MSELADGYYYALIPRKYLRHTAPNGVKLNKGTINLFALLLTFRGMKEIRFSQTTLGKAIGVTRQMISQYLKELVRAEMIIKVNIRGETCKIDFHPDVNKSIQACKENLTQESKVIKNKVALSQSLDVVKYYTEMFISETRKILVEGQYETWISSFADIFRMGFTENQVLLVIDHIATNHHWRSRIHSPLDLMELDKDNNLNIQLILNETLAEPFRISYNYSYKGVSN